MALSRTLLPREAYQLCIQRILWVAVSDYLFLELLQGVFGLSSPALLKNEKKGRLPRLHSNSKEQNRSRYGQKFPLLRRFSAYNIAESVEKVKESGSSFRRTKRKKLQVPIVAWSWCCNGYSMVIFSIVTRSPISLIFLSGNSVLLRYSRRPFVNRSCSS